MFKITLYNIEKTRKLLCVLREYSCSTDDSYIKKDDICENKMEGDIYFTNYSNRNILHIMVENVPYWIPLFQDHIGDDVFEKLTAMKDSEDNKPSDVRKEPQFASLFETIPTKPALH